MNSILCNGNVPRNSSNDSVVSVVLPWRIIHQRRCQIIPPDTESEKDTKLLAFYLCMTSVMLLTTGVGISITALWSLLYKLPYVQLSGNIVVTINDMLTFWAAILCLPGFWITCSLHNINKKFKFFRLLISLCSVCIILIIIISCVSLTFKTQIKNDLRKSPHLTSAYFRKHLNETLCESMRTEKRRKTWDKVQEHLKCCGTNNYTEWLIILKELPKSCYVIGILHDKNCLNKIGFELMWGASLTFNINLIMLLVQIFALSVILGAYISAQKNSGS